MARGIDVIASAWRISLVSFLLAAGLAPASEREKPVAYLGERVLTLRTALGEVSVPIEMSTDLGADPEATRAAIVFHGKGRNVKGYFNALVRAAAEAGPDAQHTILLAPQFLREEDAAAHHLPRQFLRWHAGSWTSGEPAVGPAPLSAFDVIDGLLAILGNHGRFPNLRSIVLVGHSGGGQLLNRYAIVGKQWAAISTAGVHVRFVVANPSPYFYFSEDRPLPNGSFAPFRSVTCPDFDHWRYGRVNAPRYVGDTSSAAWESHEHDYALADVIYLLGADDTDPAQVDLDTSCAGEAQGPERLDRGKAYFRYLKVRHAEEFRQQLWLVPGVAHVGSRMVDSPCGIAAVFDHGSCSGSSNSAN
jgi:hypothetical protein